MPKITSPLTFDFARPDGSLVRINKGENTVDKDVSDSAVIKQICGKPEVPANEALNQSPGEPDVKKDVTDPDKLAADAALASADASKNVPTKG